MSVYDLNLMNHVRFQPNYIFTLIIIFFLLKYYQNYYSKISVYDLNLMNTYDKISTKL